jgi:hypothetical protein
MVIRDLQHFWELRNLLEAMDGSALTQILLRLAYEHNCEIEITIESDEEDE